MPRIAVLCGTGMSHFASTLSSISGVKLDSLIAESPWGEVPIVVVENDFGQVFVIDRHHSEVGERTPPHCIEHRANVYAVSSCNPDIIVSVNSVGSMLESMPPGTIGVADDVLDLSIQPWTFHDDEAFHSDRTSPFDSSFSKICEGVLELAQGSSPNRVIVAQCIGPQFETPIEIDALERLGANVVGMTLGPEQRLISETGIPHVSLPCSSNWAAGRTPGNPDSEINHESVDEMASGMRDIIAKCVLKLMQSID
ncbi:MAG: hypothetical protein CMA88_01685 [Euryarchaeota archaeon]|nr:hypothetical protein [Euryarchaeota archaeon]|tara:strand:- start:574 stop:1335 length:762 start_codon:yes stop_codon:yes gene_type:complete